MKTIYFHDDGLTTHDYPSLKGPDEWTIGVTVSENTIIKLKGRKTEEDEKAVDLTISVKQLRQLIELDRDLHEPTN